ncbi:unnamed protein product [Caenorhabditis auriculariae]|uniref:Serine-threonine/tyrosine-protein kinase catalytic domain-containing protein n=1 Tax=Caenorhabditis auriculariae TaxID=2777116 RepID=A0A8S1HV74_9PELO|nr:unnamed protein product [Caenorhabditis auriculariae]
MVVAENLPTRYLAPECLVRFAFNAQTDIFAFGHLVCEIHNKCEIPYAGMSGLEARKEIAAGKVLTVHSRAPEALRLYVADRLFAFHPIYRPAMHEVVGFLKKLLDWLRKRHPNEREVERTVDTSARSVQPSYPKKDLFERMEPSSAAQSPPVDVAE